MPYPHVRWQKWHCRDTRSLTFHKEVLPAIDEFFLNTSTKEEIYEGYIVFLNVTDLHQSGEHPISRGAIKNVQWHSKTREIFYHSPTVLLHIEGQNTQMMLLWKKDLNIYNPRLFEILQKSIFVLRKLTMKLIKDHMYNVKKINDVK